MSLSADPAFRDTSGQGIVAHGASARGAIETGRAVDVTSHRRSWMLRTGMVVAMAAGTLVSVATPALAAPGDPSITINSLSNGNMQPGSQSTLSFTVKAGFGGGGSMQISVTSSLNPDVTLVRDGNCVGTCQFVDTLDDGQAKQAHVAIVRALVPLMSKP